MMNQDIREHLSALIDNELDRDRTRFLLKRAEHDTELAAVWQRWHFYGEAMRGTALPLRKDFARAIAARLDEDAAAPQAAPSQGSQVLRWGGGFAVAASVALAALLFTRPGVDPVAPMPAGQSLADAPQVNVPESVVAPSPYRVEDLRPPYRFDAQTVSSREDPRYGAQLRYDPRFEAYWLRHQQAVNGRSGEASAPWLSPLAPEAQPAPAH